VLEGEANSSRQEWGGSAVPFIESRGEKKGHQGGHGAPAFNSITRFNAVGFSTNRGR
jgi:hypothetical protein